PESVHLCAYPQPRVAWIRPRIESDMALVRSVVELGRSLRAAHNLKIRQPLSRLSLVVPAERAQALARLGDIIGDELNVKSIQLLDDETALIAYSARPNLKV